MQVLTLWKWGYENQKHKCLHFCSWKLYCLYSLHAFNWHFFIAANGGVYTADYGSRTKINIFMLYILNFPHQDQDILAQNSWHSVTTWVLFTLDFVQRTLQGMGAHDGGGRVPTPFCFLALQLYFYSHYQKV